MNSSVAYRWHDVHPIPSYCSLTPGKRTKEAYFPQFCLPVNLPFLFPAVSRSALDQQQLPDILQPSAASSAVYEDGFNAAVTQRGRNVSEVTEQEEEMMMVCCCS